MEKLTIIANIVANADKIELVRDELLKLIDNTRQELGCINYDLHQDQHNPAHFVFYENWQSAQALEAHLASKHISEYAQAVEGAIESFTIHRLTQVG